MRMRFGFATKAFVGGGVFTGANAGVGRAVSARAIAPPPHHFRDHVLYKRLIHFRLPLLFFALFASLR
jgi:hypothetical protein